MGAFLDLFRVLYEPSAVFGRVTEKTRVIEPMIGLVLIQLILTAFSLPYIRALIQYQVSQAPAGSAANPALALKIGTIAAFIAGPIFLIIILLVAALLLWVLQAVMNGDAQFGKLLSVTAYASITALLGGIVGFVVLSMRGAESITSGADLRPMLGLNLLVPDAGKFMTTLLGSINPFGLWGMVLTAIGIKVTHKTTDSAAYTVSVTAFVIGILIASALSILQK